MLSVASFIRTDRVFMPQREPNIIQAFQQAVPLKLTYDE